MTGRSVEIPRPGMPLPGFLALPEKRETPAPGRSCCTRSSV